MIRTGSELTQTGPGPVDIGTGTACLNSSVQISCAITNSHKSRIVRRQWTLNGMSLNTDMETITATEIGTYTCEVQNDCGNDTSSTKVLCEF